MSNNAGEEDLDQREQKGPRITYADDVENRPRRARSARRQSMDSMSIRSMSRTVDPSLMLPPQFRTL